MLLERSSSLSDALLHCCLDLCGQLVLELLENHLFLLRDLQALEAEELAVPHEGARPTSQHGSEVECIWLALILGLFWPWATKTGLLYEAGHR